MVRLNEGVGNAADFACGGREFLGAADRLAVPLSRAVGLHPVNHCTARVADKILSHKSGSGKLTPFRSETQAAIQPKKWGP
jgi:hypothetical protein